MTRRSTVCYASRKVETHLRGAGHQDHDEHGHRPEHHSGLESWLRKVTAASAAADLPTLTRSRPGGTPARAALARTLRTDRR